MIQGMAHSAVTVSDMTESIRFYTQALGFRKAFSIRHPDTGEPWIEYLNVCSGQFVELFYGGSEEQPWNGSVIGFNHLCFQVDDVHASVRMVREAGYPIDSEPVLGTDGNWQAWIRDPNGIRIELMQIMPGSPQSRFDKTEN